MKILYYFMMITSLYSSATVHSQELIVKNTKTMLKRLDIYDQALNKSYKPISNLLVVYKKGLKEEISSIEFEKNRWFQFKGNITYLTLNELKIKYKNNNLTTKKHIKEITDAENCDALMILNCREDNNFEVYIYENMFGNCLYSNRTTAIPKYENHRAILFHATNHLNTYAAQLINKNIVIMQTGWEKSFTKDFSPYSKYATYLNYSIFINPDVLLLHTHEESSKFEFSTYTMANRLLHFSLPKNNSELLQINYLKEGGRVKTYKLMKEEYTNEEYLSLHQFILKSLDLRLSASNYSTAKSYTEMHLNRNENKVFYYRMLYSLMPDYRHFSSGYFGAIQNLSPENIRSNEKFNETEKFEIEKMKLNFLNEELIRRRVPNNESNFMIDFNAIFKTTTLTKIEKEILLNLKLKILKDNIDVLVNEKGLQIRYFSELGLETPDGMLQGFQIFHDQMTRNNYSRLNRYNFSKSYFDSVKNYFARTTRSMKESIKGNDTFIYQYEESNDDLLKLLALKTKIKDNCPDDMLLFKKILPIYHNLLLKNIDVASNEDLHYLSMINDKNEKDELASELMETILTYWNKSDRFIYNRFYFSVLLARFDFKNLTKENTEILYANLKKQISLTSTYFKKWIKSTKNYYRDDLENNFLYAIRDSGFDQKKKEDLFKYYYLSYLEDYVNLKTNQSAVNELAISFVDKAAENQFSDDILNICLTLRAFLITNNYFKDKPRPFEQFNKDLDVIKFNNLKSKLEISTPDFLKFKVTLTNTTIISDLKFIETTSSGHYRANKNYGLNHGLASSLFYCYSKNDNTLKFVLLKKELLTGITSFSDTFDASLLLENSTKFDFNTGKTSFFENSFYVIHAKQLYLIDHNTKQTSLIKQNNFANDNITSTFGFKEKLFVFQEDKITGNKLVLFDLKKNTTKIILINDELGANGLINSNEFIVNNMYEYADNIYVNLNSRITGSNEKTDKLCLLDLENSMHQNIGLLSHSNINLYFYSDKVFYFIDGKHYIKNLKTKKDFVGYINPWGSSHNDAIPIKNGILFTQKIDSHIKLAYFDFESKSLSINFEDDFNSLRYCRLISAENSLIIVDQENNVFHFPLLN